MNLPPSPAVPASAPWRGDLLAVALTVGWLVAVRTALDCPWGFAPVPAPGGLAMGIPFAVDDTWSYLSWINQYREGSVGAGLLYTTEPHSALLWIFPLWLIGRLAALTGLPALGVYSVAGVAAAAAAVLAFRRAARALGLEASACDWATVALVLGSGGSWVWHLAHRLGLAPLMNGAEFRYMDLFPSSAFVVFPYHALSYALLAALWWSVAASEVRLTAQKDSRGPLAATALVAVLLSVSRPYEPVAFAGAYGLKTLWTWWRRASEPEAWRASRLVSIVLGAALLPGIAWNVYVALQPVWSTFAHRSLAQGFDRIGWCTAFGGLWILGIAGLKPALGGRHLRGALPITATVLGAAVLLGFNQTQAKLASGLTLGLALLAGWGAAMLIRSAKARWHPLLVGTLGGPVLGCLLGGPSLAMVLLAIRLTPQATIEPELLALAQQIPLQTSGHRTVVLADSRIGAMLPGLRGLRVYAGHFSLTNDFEAKVARLQRAGFDAAALPAAPADIRSALAQLLPRIAADAALLDVRCTTAIEALRQQGWQIAAANARWVWLRPPRPPP